MQIQTEVCNFCNAECVFCHWPNMVRAKGVMSMDLFRKIVDEAATIPEVNQFTLTGLGETLIDKHLIERLKYVRKMMPKLECLDLYTNGTLLTDKMIDDLVGLIDVLYVSLNAVDEGQRQQIMKLDDYEEVKEQCHNAIKKAKGTRTRVVVKCVGSKDLLEAGDAELFLNEWHGPHDQGGNAFIHLEGNWGGDTFKMRTVPRRACFRALTQIMILWDGRVSLCCFDGEGKVTLGNLNTQGIREVYNGEKALNYRLAHVEGRRHTLDLCKDCTQI